MNKIKNSIEFFKDVYTISNNLIDMALLKEMVAFNRKDFIEEQLEFCDIIPWNRLLIHHVTINVEALFKSICILDEESKISLVKNRMIDLKYIDKHEMHFRSINISRYRKTNEEFLDKYPHYINDFAVYNDQLSASFIERHIARFSNIQKLLEHQQLPESILVNYLDKFSNEISKYQVLSPDFIQEHSYKLNWYYMVRYDKSKLSKHIVKDNIDLIKKDLILSYGNEDYYKSVLKMMGL